MQGSRVRVWVAWVFTAGWLLVIGAGSGVAREAPKVSVATVSWAGVVDPTDEATPGGWLWWRQEAGLQPRPEGWRQVPYALSAAEAESAATSVVSALDSLLGVGHGLTLAGAEAKTMYL